MQLLSLSTIYVLDFGHLPLAALLWMGSLFVRFGGLVAGSELLDELFGKRREDFAPARRRRMPRSTSPMSSTPGCSRSGDAR